MYDLILLDDLRGYKHKLDNIYEVENRYKYMLKVIKCRTQDKFDYIKWAYAENLISETQYNRFEEMIKSDYKNAMLYISGKLNITDLE